jgi:ATP-dependent exoDNAse (exonuclease V) beta subunit
VGEVIHLGDRLKTGPVTERDTLGTAVHAFLAADPGPGAPAGERETLAAQLLTAHGHAGVLAPADLLEASDRLQRFLAERYPGAKHHREWPLACWRDGQELWGQADLVLETTDGWVVIDYKTFDGTPEWAAIRFGPQLDAYAKTIETATGRQCTATYGYLVFQSVVFNLVLDATES